MTLFDMAQQIEAAEEFKLTAEENSVSSIGPGRLATPEAIKTFLFAGNAYFTVRSTRTGTRFTFRISKAKTGNTFFVSVLNGPENTKDYLYVGMIRDLKFQLTKASRVREEAASFKAFRWVYQHISRNEMPPEIEVFHEERCGRCGRKLTVPESIKNGIGPECAGYLKEAA